MHSIGEPPSSVDYLASLHDVSKSIQSKTVNGVASIIEHGDNQQLAAAESGENIRKIQRLAFLVSGLSYQDYLTVEDFTSRIRTGASPNQLAMEHGVFVGADVQHAIAVVRNTEASDEVREIIELLLELQSTEEFKDDAVLFIRATYPFGKNILNREFKKDQPSAVAVKKGVKAEFTINKTTVTVEVHDDDLCTVNCEGSTKPLKDGEALIIGKPFDRRAFFDESVKDISDGASRRITIEPELPVKNDGYVSRAGMMIVRRGGFIYAFDRGSKNKFSFKVSRNDQATMSGRYYPGGLGEDGKAGQSIIDFVLPAADLQS